MGVSAAKTNDRKDAARQEGLVGFGSSSSNDPAKLRSNRSLTMSRVRRMVVKTENTSNAIWSEKVELDIARNKNTLNQHQNLEREDVRG